MVENSTNGTDAIILSVRHKHYLSLDPAEVVKSAGGPIAVIDCFGILDDEKIGRYFGLGCEVKGLGKRHAKRIKDQVRAQGEEEMMSVGWSRAKVGGEKI